MEYALAIMSFLTVFLCLYFYRRGVKDGMGIKNGQLPRIEKPTVLMTKDEKQEKQTDIKEKEAEQQFLDDLQTIAAYQPRFTAKRTETR